MAIFSSSSLWGCDVVFCLCAARSARYFWYCSCCGDIDPAGVRALLDGGAILVLHTDGGRSVHIHTSSGEVEVPVPSVEVADTIGAGDAFGGAFAAWWDQAGLGRRDLDRADAVRAAVTAAVEVSAVSCTRVGAQPPRRAELGGTWSPVRS